MEKALNVKTNQILRPETVLNQIELASKNEILLALDSRSFDDILKGGFLAGKMYLIFGANKTGKTQLCHQLCSQSVRNSKQAYYLDTENTFRAERILEIAQNRGSTHFNILKEIKVSKIASNSTLKLLLNEIEKELHNSNDALLIVDSVNNYFRYERGVPDLSYHKTTSIFIQILAKLQELTERFNLITIATAQITPNLIENTLINELPVGNQYLNHFFSEHLHLRRNADGSNTIHLSNSQYLPERKATYFITARGIEDIKSI